MTTVRTRILLNLGLLGVFSVLSFSIAEYYAGKLGYRPGVHTVCPWLQHVDSLKALRGLSSDSLGIHRIPSDVGSEIAEMIAKDSFQLSDDQFAGVYQIAEQSIALRSGKSPGELHTAYLNAIASEADERNPWQNELIRFVHSGVNSDGYRSIEFHPLERKKPSVLLLDDSFTFGHSASSLHRSFADLLLARGYIVYNSGITATDAAQYLGVAKHWIPRLRPDVVIVNFYLGNDVVYFKRESSSERPVFYLTNAGILMSEPNGVFLETPEQAYEVCRYWTAISPAAGWFAKAMSQTAITSAVYGLLWRNGFVYHESDFIRNYNSRAQKAELSHPYSREELLLIDSIAREYGAKSIISVIPELVDGRLRTAEDAPEAFSGLEYVQIKASPDDYLPEDGHFNDHGHRRYADFLQKLIDEE